jgi:hypothetical protein
MSARDHRRFVRWSDGHVFRWYRRRGHESPDEPGEEFWRKRGEFAGELVGAAVTLVSVALLLVARVWVVRTWF